MIDKASGGDFTTVIGSDAVFKGELAFEKGVRVDGKVEGKITTKGNLAISQAGKLQADVQAGNIVVEGQVNGNLGASFARRAPQDGPSQGRHQGQDPARRRRRRVHGPLPGRRGCRCGCVRQPDGPKRSDAP